jgi:hypothetical protein
MEQRYGVWAGLMSLCRLVFDGGGPSENYLPARKGQLFNPAEYPWLETPWISDGVVLAVLRNLLIVNGERINYRALDVEQIGSVYEGIMGYAVRRIPGRCKLPWRYRWPDAVRDDVLARLLALNAERYAEEVDQGLHSKGGSKGSGAAAAGGKRRGRPAKTADSTDTEQIGLAL